MIMNEQELRNFLGGDYPSDLSAFLIGHIEKGHYEQEKLTQDFPVFYKLMKEFLHQPPKTGRLVWYLN
jgi:hypothetical protein